ncbi:MAG: family 78 glycoside hydrolase catalytic domain [Clostridia bacterium]|nr:family 78 glycoside hydrolase catalytic domain [Clostridia bacterium]
MTQKEMFGKSIWVEPAEKIAFPVLRRVFRLNGKFEKVTLRAVGLGFFHAYVNGQEVNDSAFLPLNTDFEARKDYPVDEKLFGHRLIVPEFDITKNVREGENLLAIHFGGGWYTFQAGPFGDAKAIYQLTVEGGGKKETFCSGESDVFADSFVTGDYNFTFLESHDYTGFDDKVISDVGYNGKTVAAKAARPLETEYLFSDCPGDRVTEVITPRVINEYEKDGARCRVYDAGKNISAVPVVKILAKEGGKVALAFSEEKTSENMIDTRYMHRQTFVAVSDGKGRTISPRFTWFAFRYIEVCGDAEVVSVGFVHADIGVSSTFDSDCEALNWLYKAYINTQLSNMHAGIPSDCPHIERRGYTGDGQLTCQAAMTVLDARKFYRKWIDDISDCQDVLTGHVQYTAPYIRSGGGPGAWGCAIVEVPYRYYKEYGDIEPARRLYPQMLRYFDYLEDHSLNDIVVSDKAGEWCLGDWCTLTPTALPAGFVNNYYYIKSMRRAIEIARLIGREEDVPGLLEKIGVRLKATNAAYYNTWDHNFLANIQGANAFALDMGLGDEATKQFLVGYYAGLKQFDTGICGTDVVTRVLFDIGQGDVAVDLLLGDRTFAGWMKAGFTTLSEYWLNSTRDRSHSHPMFGSPVTYFFERLLGITQEPDSAGYEKLVIAPFIPAKSNRLSGSRELPCGKVSASYSRDEKDAANVHALITLPEGKTAAFRYKETVITLKAGENRFDFRV